MGLLLGISDRFHFVQVVFLCDCVELPVQAIQEVVHLLEGESKCNGGSRTCKIIEARQGTAEWRCNKIIRGAVNSTDTKQDEKSVRSPLSDRVSKTVL